MTVTNIGYAAQLNIQHYIVPIKLDEIDLGDLETARAGGTALTNWLNVADAMSGPMNASYAFTGTPPALVLTVNGATYPLDGTGDPIQILNVTSAPHATETADETVITHDQQTRGSAITVGVTDTHSFAFAGMTVHRNIDHKIMEIFREIATDQGLAVKYLRVGHEEKKICYARFSSKSEQGDAGTLAKFSANLQVLGAVKTIPAAIPTP